MKHAITTTAVIFCLALVSAASATAQDYTDDILEAPETGAPPPAAVSGTSLTLQHLMGRGVRSYQYGVRWFSGHHMMLFQFKSRSDRPDASYQASLDREKWIEVALMYGYRHSEGSLRLHAAAGPAYIHSTRLGAFISSREWEQTVEGKKANGKPFYVSASRRADTYDVLDEESAGLVFDLGIGTQFARHYYAGFGLHGAITPRTSEYGIAFTFGFGAF